MSEGCLVTRRALFSRPAAFGPYVRFSTDCIIMLRCSSLGLSAGLGGTLIGGWMGFSSVAIPLLGQETGPLKVFVQEPAL